MVSDRSEPSSTLPLPCIRTLVLVSGIKLVNSSYGDIIMNKVHGLHSKQCEHSSVSTAARARQCEHSSARAAAVLVLYPWCLGYTEYLAINFVSAQLVPQQGSHAIPLYIYFKYVKRRV